VSSSDVARPKIRLRAGTAFRLRHRDPGVTYEVDCRMLFMGDRLAALERIFAEISRAFRDAGDATDLERRLAQIPDFARFYDVGRTGGPVCVTLRDDVFREPGPVEELPLTAEFTSGDRRCEWPLPPADLRAIGALLPLLVSGAVDADEARDRLRRDLERRVATRAVELLDVLESGGFLEPSAVGVSFFERPFAAPRATLLGHSSLLIQSARGALLVDPILRRDQNARPEAFDAMNLRLDAILCSHSHWDHCDLQTLLWFDKRTPVLVPRHRRATIFNPPIAATLARLGFRDVREIDHWVPVRIGDFEVVAVPFRGEQDEPDAEIDHYTYVIRTEGLTLFGGVDSYRDTLGDMRPVLARVRDEYRPSVAFLPISKMVYDYATGGVNGFCRFLDADLFRSSFQYTASAEDAAEWVATLRPRWVCPYAIFTFSRWATSPEIADFAQALRRLGLADRLFPLRPLDALDRHDLAATSRAQWRRGLRVGWSSAAPALVRIRQGRPYRLLRRAVGVLT